MRWLPLDLGSRPRFNSRARRDSDNRSARNARRRSAAASFLYSENDYSCSLAPSLVSPHQESELNCRLVGLEAAPPNRSPTDARTSPIAATALRVAATT